MNYFLTAIGTTVSDATPVTLVGIFVSLAAILLRSTHMLALRLLPPLETTSVPLIPQGTSIRIVGVASFSAHRSWLPWGRGLCRKLRSQPNHAVCAVYSAGVLVRSKPCLHSSWEGWSSVPGPKLT